MSFSPRTLALPLSLPLIAVATAPMLAMNATSAQSQAPAKPVDPSNRPTPPDDPSHGGPPPDAPKDAKPDHPRGLMLREPGTYDGYTLLAPLNSKSIHLVDMDGKVVHTWALDQVPGGGTYLLDNGHLLRCAQKDDNPRFHGGGIGGLIQEIDWDGKIVWEYELATKELTQHHDMFRFKNGNIAFIAWEYHSPEEQRTHGRDPAAILDEGLWTDVIMEIRPTHPRGGDVVWQWRAWDHLVQDYDSKAPDYGQPREHPGCFDLNADYKFLKKTETPEEKKKREERAAQMRALGYAGGKDPNDDDDKKKLGADAHASNEAKSSDASGANHSDANGSNHSGASDDAKRADDPNHLAHAGPDDAKHPPDPTAPPRRSPDDPKRPGGPRKLESDWMHTNAIDYNPDLDLLVLSSPHACEIFVIDHSTTSAEAAGKSGGRWGKGGELLYRFGNPQNYGMGRPEDKKLFYQHNVTWSKDAPKGELRVMLFNNGSERPGKEYSSVEELVLPFDRKSGFVREPDRTFGPKEAAWSYSDPENFFSGFISGAQRLPNGNTLICAGAPGRVFEITKDKRIVWDYWNPLGGEVTPAKQAGKAPPKALFRATRIAANDPALAKLER
jgi:hypothetical protein